VFLFVRFNLLKNITETVSQDNERDNKAHMNANSCPRLAQTQNAKKINVSIKLINRQTPLID